MANEKEERKGREKVTKWYERQRRLACFVLFFKRMEIEHCVCKDDDGGLLHEGQENVNKHGG